MEEKVLTEKEKQKRREERRRRKKYRLLILLLLLFGTGVMLATSTYAWFTSNKTVSVNTLNVSIEARNGIQISADGTNWKSIVQTTDLTSVHDSTYSTSVNQLPDVLEPVSTGGTVSAAGRLPMFYGTVDTSESAENSGEYILTAEPATETEGNGPTSTGKFIAFDLFFKVTNVTPLYLTPGSKVETDQTPDGIKNASRIGFVILGNIADGSAVTAIQALNAGASSPVYLWEPNYEKHTATGIANAFDVYGITTNDNAATSIPYSGVIATITDAEDILLGKATATDNEDYFKDVSINYKTTFGHTNYLPIFSLQPGITKIRIYMWVEGQDVDCENNASGGSINFDLQITTEDPTAPPPETP